jgi:hypothetical protein
VKLRWTGTDFVPLIFCNHSASKTKSYDKLSGYNIKTFRATHRQDKRDNFTQLHHTDRRLWSMDGTTWNTPNEEALSIVDSIWNTAVYRDSRPCSCFETGWYEKWLDSSTKFCNFAELLTNICNYSFLLSPSTLSVHRILSFDNIGIKCTIWRNALGIKKFQMRKFSWVFTLEKLSHTVWDIIKFIHIFLFVVIPHSSHSEEIQ